MDVDQLLDQLTQIYNSRSRRINIQHVMKIADLIYNVRGLIGIELYYKIVEILSTYNRDNIYSTHDILVQGWRELLSDQFNSTYESIRDKKPDEEYPDPESLEKELKKLEDELFSTDLTIERDDYDYVTLGLSIKIMKELRDK